MACAVDERASGRTTANTSTFFSPRVRTILRSGNWSTRMSAGTGFFGPSVLTEETEAAGLTRLTVSGPLQAERGRSVSIDLTRTTWSDVI